jgi:hypothetical protein
VELLSNHFWHLFLSRIDGKINGEAWELKVANRGERRVNRWERERERYKYPSGPNGQLSAALPH